MDLVEIDELDKTKSNGRFAHKVIRVRKKPRKASRRLKQKYQNLWYLKIDKDTFEDYTPLSDSDSEQTDLKLSAEEAADKNAVFEVVAQEFFRLFIPSHPKTRLVLDTENDIHYIMSKHVPGYRALDTVNKDELREGIKNGMFTGLGDVLVIALLLNEIDLKFGNLCLNEHNQIIKIDGDRCFARINGFKNKNYYITEADIVSLPFIYDYFAYNWLDLILHEPVGLHKQKAIRSEPRSIDVEISSHPRFRAEVNRALLKVILLPDDLIGDFIASYADLDSDIAEIYEEVLDRKSQLFKAAVYNQSFRRYLSSMEAVKLAHDYAEYLKKFKTTGKHTLPMDKYEKEIIHNYLDLRARLVNEVKPRRSVRFKGTLFSEKARTGSCKEDISAKQNKTPGP